MNEESEKAGLKLNIKETKIMASGSITSWQIEVEKLEAVTDFLFSGFKITVDGDCSQKIRRQLLLWQERYDKPKQCVKNERHHFADKVCTVKALVFPVVTYGYESWTLKKAEAPKNRCFGTMVLEKTLESSLESKEIKPVKLEGNQP